MQLEINGEKYRLIWGLGAFQDLCDRLEITINDIDLGLAVNDIKITYGLTYSAIRNGAKLDNKEVGISYDEFLYWLDQQPEDMGTKIIDDYLNSKYLGKTMKDRYDEILARLNQDNSETGVKKTSKKKS